MNIADKLQEAIQNATKERVEEKDAGHALMLVAQEAVGYLRAYGEVNVKQVMYDMARVAAANGYVPDDFDKRAAEAGKR